MNRFIFSSIVLIFGTSALLSVSSLMKGSKSWDSILFQTQGLESVNFILLILMVLIDLYVVYAIFRKKKNGLYFAISSILLSTIHNFLLMKLTLANRELFIDIVVLKEQKKGRAITPEIIEFLSSSPLIIGSFVAVFSFSFILLVYIIWQRKPLFYPTNQNITTNHNGTKGLKKLGTSRI